MSAGRLYVFAGLPGCGKSTLASRLATHLNAVYLRIDTIEQRLREFGITVEGEGYLMAYQLAAENLKLGLSVIADSVNPISLTRQAWCDVAAEAGGEAINIEIICSDPEEHRTRVEQRKVNVPGLVLPTWQQVLEREYDPWLEIEPEKRFEIEPEKGPETGSEFGSAKCVEKRIVIDTAGCSVETAFQNLLQKLPP